MAITMKLFIVKFMNTKEPEDCIFVINEDKETLSTYCLNCYQEKINNEKGMFWNGAVRGYGPWEIKCDSCNKVIHEGPDADQ